MSITESPDTAETAARFLRSDTGRAAVHRTLEARGLPRALADDVIQDALRRVCVASLTGDTAVDNIEAFVVTVVQRAAVDILRGRIRRPQVIDLHGVDPDAGVQGWPLAAMPLDVGADIVAEESLAAVRRAVHHSLTIDPLAGAAALAYLAVAVDGAVPPADCPRPRAGATATDAAEWAGLWCSGRRDCFPGEALDPRGAGAADAARVRKRRSRGSRHFRRVLTDAAASAGLGREGATRG